MKEMNDDDLRVLASFRAEAGEPDAKRLAGIRAEYLKGKTVSTRTGFFTPRRAAVIGVPVLAAVAAGAIALTVAGGPNGTAPDAAGDTNVTQFDLANADAKSVLDYTAQNVGNYATVSVEEGQYLYAHTTGSYKSAKLDDALVEYTEDTWYKTDGTILPVKMVVTENGTTEEDDSLDEEGDEDTATVQYPSLDYLAGLPTDPAVLLEQFRAEMRAQLDGGLGDGEEFGDDDLDFAVFAAVAELLDSTDVIIAPEQRSTIFEALALMDGVSKTEGTVTDANGRDGVAIGYTHDNGQEETRNELILDPETSEVLGSRQLQDGDVTSLSSATLTVVDEIGAK